MVKTTVKQDNAALKPKKFDLQPMPEYSDEQLAELAQEYASKYNSPKHLVQAKRLQEFGKMYYDLIKNDVAQQVEKELQNSEGKTTKIAGAKVTLKTINEYSTPTDVAYLQLCQEIEHKKLLAKKEIELLEIKLKNLEKIHQLQSEPIKVSHQLSISLK
jgi:hypothetical protein